MPTFVELQDEAALLSLEHQLHLADVVGIPPWTVDFTVPRFAFTGDKPLTVSALHLLGSAAPGPRSWLWSWASRPDDYRPEVTSLAERLREYGEEHGISELTEAEIPFDALPGAPTEPSVVASQMMEAAKAVLGRWTGYQAMVGRGTRFGMLIEHPSFALPEPDFSRVSRVLHMSLAELRLYDQRRAFRSYAINRGLRVQENDTQMRIEGPGVGATVGFTENNLVSAMSIGVD
ncbi:DUF6882 domain-containing protein [Allokutzneria sp. NRRL B-24872]|uniref:DUF6882 domain-containing protein n=1 Tax=Allokutzneria sp. NRRL B-24872 TaxID=1137961 RepID=UPI001AEF48EC|nr:DUF6882 domain-containing protein [Allokutzneria sp. NRRL B-24872]